MDKKITDININRQDQFNKKNLISQKNNKFKYPIFSSIELNIHGSCNRRCAFCPRVDEELYPNLDEYLDINFFRKMLGELKQNNYTGRMGFSGFSEPLLHKNIVEIVSLYKEMFPENRLEIVTNGDYLDFDMAKKLFDNGLYNIRVSLYTNPKNEKKFLEIRKNLNLSEERFFVRHRNLGRKNDFGLVMNNRAGSVDYSRIGQGQKIKELPLKQGCNYPMFKLFIDYNGDCLLCSNDWSKKKVIGNAKKQNVYDIWHSELVNKARKMLLSNNRNFSPCDKCDVDGLLNGNEFKQSWEKYFFEKKN